ncbi:MAG: hypothetical protein H7Z37_19020 [Pyrinomonadaceae bacterium]|nr:hypothetical protein [Pyrinomonadaceae bacterium]
MKNSIYLNQWKQSLVIPLVAAFVLAVHFIVEAFAYNGQRGGYIIASFVLCPLIVNVFVRKRRMFYGALVNGLYMAVSYADYATQHDLSINLRELPVVLIAMAFGVLIAVSIGGFIKRILR